MAFLLLSGIAMGGSWIFLYEAYKLIGVGLATVAYYCGPVLVMALAPAIFKEKLVGAKIIAIGAALVGIALINRQGLSEEGISWGLVCGLLSAALLAAMVIFNRLAASITGFENSVWQLTTAFLTVAAFTIVQQGPFIHIPSGSLMPAIALGLINTGFGCYLYFSSMQRLPAQSVPCSVIWSPYRPWSSPPCYWGNTWAPSRPWGQPSSWEGRPSASTSPKKRPAERRPGRIKIQPANPA